MKQVSTLKLTQQRQIRRHIIPYLQATTRQIESPQTTNTKKWYSLKPNHNSYRQTSYILYSLFKPGPYHTFQFPSPWSLRKSLSAIASPLPKHSLTTSSERKETKRRQFTLLKAFKGNKEHTLYSPSLGKQQMCAYPETLYQVLYVRHFERNCSTENDLLWPNSSTKNKEGGTTYLLTAIELRTFNKERTTKGRKMRLAKRAARKRKHPTLDS